MDPGKVLEAKVRLIKLMSFLSKTCRQAHAYVKGLLVAVSNCLAVALGSERSPGVIENC